MTKIEWTDRTWNPTTGCNKVSQGCRNCYAQKQHARLQHMHPGKYTKGFLEGVQTHEDVLREPFKWKKPARVFVNSMSDLFHADVPFEFIEKVFNVMANCRQHTFQILTKRQERMLEFHNWWCDNNSVTNHYRKIKHLYQNMPLLNNVWLGTSVENQETANERIPYLLQVPAAVRFLSCEPLLGPVDIKLAIHKFWIENDVKENGEKIHWVIAGGESGPGARPMHPDWVCSLRDQCAAANVPFFFKQWGDWSIEKIFSPKRKSIAGTFISTLGHRCGFSVLMRSEMGRYQDMYRIGKKLSGNLLDGKQYLNFPETQKPTA